MFDQAIAANRFGLGARPGERIEGDARRALLAQFDRFDPKPAAFASAPDRKTVAGGLADYLEQARGLRQQGGGRKQQAQPQTMTAAPIAPKPARDAMQQARKYVRQESRGEYIALVGARANAALISSAPFVERLTHFWANHFAVSADKLTVIGLAGLLEFEAIRPNVLGTFSDLLFAVERHPAMLLYLDQAQSIGPNSAVGARVAARGVRKVGLNENLAREIMELHTLGVRTGYAQGDVTEFARALTGWTVSGIGRGPGVRMLGISGNPGDYAFVPAMHEPGERTIMGRRYAQQGEAQARAIIADLATNSATATHISTKLARHFTDDTPPPALVARLADSFNRSGGDLPSLYRVLIDAPEIWAAPSAKFKTPWDWTISANRALGVQSVEAQPVAGLLVQLGQPIWKPGSPAGYDDIDASWAGPDALVRRVEAAERIAAKMGANADARALAPRVLPGTLTPATAQAIARADSPGQALALMLVAPEFMRR
ncbi:MAG: DUF1800 domain-containing protein [Sphingomonadaceae bacterium]|nr:DUF1800 domain-containing protein [Sphingomonadaceae bacterium]